MDRLEQIAEALHDGWWDYRKRKGWILGPRSNVHKQHPHMAPWWQLNNEAQNQDRFIAAIILWHWLNTGRGVTPKMIHETWRKWEDAHAREHPHSIPYGQAHSHIDSNKIEDNEHQLQAGRVNHLLKSFSK